MKSRDALTQIFKVTYASTGSVMMNFLTKRIALRMSELCDLHKNAVEISKQHYMNELSAQSVI